MKRHSTQSVRPSAVCRASAHRERRQRGARGAETSSTIGYSPTLRDALRLYGEGKTKEALEAQAKNAELCSFFAPRPGTSRIEHASGKLAFGCVCHGVRGASRAPQGVRDEVWVASWVDQAKRPPETVAVGGYDEPSHRLARAPARLCFGDSDHG